MSNCQLHECKEGKCPNGMPCNKNTIQQPIVIKPTPQTISTIPQFDGRNFDFDVNKRFEAVEKTIKEIVEKHHDRLTKIETSIASDHKNIEIFINDIKYIKDELNKDNENQKKFLIIISIIITSIIAYLVHTRIYDVNKFEKIEPYGG